MKLLHAQPFCGSPAVREEASIGVTRAVTPGGGAGGPLSLKRLPVEGHPVQEPLLLSAGCQRAAVGAAVRGVLPADVSQAVAAWHGASAGRGAERSDTGETSGGTERGGGRFRPEIRQTHKY